MWGAGRNQEKIHMYAWPWSSLSSANITTLKARRTRGNDAEHTHKVALSILNFNGTPPPTRDFAMDGSKLASNDGVGRVHISTF